MSGCTPPCWQIILFFGNLIRTKLPRLCRFSGNHLSGCNKRGAPGCQVWSWTSTFLSTWAPDAFPCSDQTTCLWAAVVWHATHMGPLTEQQLTHKVIKKKKRTISRVLGLISVLFPVLHCNTRADVAKLPVSTCECGKFAKFKEFFFPSKWHF